MMKWIREKMLGHGASMGELALDFLDMFQRIKDFYYDASIETLYFYTVTTFLEKWYVGTADIETAATMIMSDVSKMAESQNIKVSLRLVACGTLIAYYGSTPKFPLKSQFSHGIIMGIVCDKIPEEL